MDELTIIRLFGEHVWAKLITLIGANLLAIYWVVKTAGKAAFDGALKRYEASLARETETHKLRLKKQEILFGKELEAVSEFIKLRYDLTPKVNHLDMDYHEACEDLASRFGQVEHTLGDFMARHSGPISDQARAYLEEGLDLVRYNKLRVHVGEPEAEAVKAAERLLELLPVIERQFLADIRLQSGLPPVAFAT